MKNFKYKKDFLKKQNTIQNVNETLNKDQDFCFNENLHIKINKIKKIKRISLGKKLKVFTNKKNSDISFSRSIENVNDTSKFKKIGK